MSTLDLSGCWAKLDRAKSHRDALEKRVVGHFMVEANRPRAVGKYDANSACHIFRIDYVPKSLNVLLLDVSLSVGDIIHNLRSALDHLAYQLALAEARRVSHRLSVGEIRRIYFPIHTTRRGPGKKKGWPDKQGAYVRRFGAANAALIKSFQPYRGRAGRPDNFSGSYGHQLTLLNQFSNRDKHRLPNVIAAAPNAMIFTPPLGHGFGEPRMGNPSVGRAGSTVRLGAELVFRHVFSGPNVADVQVSGDITPIMVIPRRGLVIPAMDRIAGFVREIVQTFDSGT